MYQIYNKKDAITKNPTNFYNFYEETNINTYNFQNNLNAMKNNKDLLNNALDNHSKFVFDYDDSVIYTLNIEKKKKFKKEFLEFNF